MATIASTTSKAVLQAQGDALAGLLGAKKSTTRGSSVASSLVGTSLAASRPAFELRFNAMQNSWLDRINIKIREYNAIKTDENLTVELDLKRKRLLADSEDIGAYSDRAQSNRNLLQDISDSLNLLSIELDPNEFVRIRDEIQYKVDLLKTTFLDPFGIPDGLQQLKNRFASGFDLTGTPSSSGTFETLTVGTLSTAQILEIRAKVIGKTYAVQANRDNAVSLQDDITNDLTDVDAAISKVKDTLLAAKAKEINDLKEKAANILNILSLQYEASNSQATQFANAAIMPLANARGSVLNLIS